MKADLILFAKTHYKQIIYVVWETFLGKNKDIKSNSTPELLWNISKSIWELIFSRRK